MLNAKTYQSSTPKHVDPHENLVHFDLNIMNQLTFSYFFMKTRKEVHNYSIKAWVHWKAQHYEHAETKLLNWKNNKFVHVCGTKNTCISTINKNAHTLLHQHTCMIAACKWEQNISTVTEIVWQNHLKSLNFWLFTQTIAWQNHLVNVMKLMTFYTTVWQNYVVNVMKLMTFYTTVWQNHLVNVMKL